MTCVDHDRHIEGCMACEGRWDREEAERILREDLYGYQAAAMRMALAEIDRLTEQGRRHLATCATCEGELRGVMQLDSPLEDLCAIFDRRRAVVEAAVAWVRAGGTLAELTAAVNALEDG